jgi:hypothetical protein
VQPVHYATTLTAIGCIGQQGWTKTILNVKLQATVIIGSGLFVSTFVRLRQRLKTGWETYPLGTDSDVDDVTSFEQTQEHVEGLFETNHTMSHRVANEDQASLQELDCNLG